MVDTRHIAFVLYPGALSLDVTGPMEVFHLANQYWAVETKAVQPLYQCTTYGTERESISFSSGLRVIPDGHIAQLNLSSLHTLVIPGGWWPDSEAPEVREICELLRRSVQQVKRVASVCTGSFYLAHSGILDGRKATTHWAHCQKLQRLYPQIQVKSNDMFVRDGNIYTAAGVSAGIDLALSLVEEDVGAQVAQQVARYMVLYLRRQGGQSQFSTFTRPKTALNPPIQRVQTWISEHIREDLRVEVLAKIANMSVRHFARTFKREVGMSPARFVQRARVETARNLLEQSDDKLPQIASLCGFTSAEVMRRVFIRILDVPPQTIRMRFHEGRPSKG